MKLSLKFKVLARVFVTRSFYEVLTCPKIKSIKNSRKIITKHKAQKMTLNS